MSLKSAEPSHRAKDCAKQICDFYGEVNDGNWTRIIQAALDAERLETYRHAAELCRVKAELHSNPDLADCHEQDAAAIEQCIKELEGK